MRTIRTLYWSKCASGGANAIERQQGNVVMTRIRKTSCILVAFGARGPNYIVQCFGKHEETFTRLSKARMRAWKSCGNAPHVSLALQRSQERFHLRVGFRGLLEPRSRAERRFFLARMRRRSSIKSATSRAVSALRAAISGPVGPARGCRAFRTGERPSLPSDAKGPSGTTSSFRVCS